MILLEFVPTYEYECPRCPRIFEVRQRISEPPLTTCDRCGGPIHRLLSAAPFILKGGGWYVTDYPSESRKKAQSAESSASGSDASSKEAPAKDAKPAESKSSDAKPKQPKPDKPDTSKKSGAADSKASTSGSSSSGGASGGTQSS
jgi:putative FmdB family regulatory protein